MKWINPVLRSYRSGSGLPVVLLHPIGLDHACWEGVVARLRDTFEVIAVDLRGHGASSDRPEGYEIADDADEVAALIRDLEIGPVVVVGVSFGGMIAQELAIRHPNLVLALVPCACPPRISEENRAAIAGRGDKALTGGASAIVNETLERWFATNFREEGPARAVARRLAANKPQNWANAWGAISRFDALDELVHVRQPALCIAGEKDIATPMPAMETLAAALPAGSLTIMAEAPHMLHIEQATEFAGLIKTFLQDLPSAVQSELR